MPRTKRPYKQKRMSKSKIIRHVLQDMEEPYDYKEMLRRANEYRNTLPTEVKKDLTAIKLSDCHLTAMYKRKGRFPEPSTNGHAPPAPKKEPLVEPVLEEVQTELFPAQAKMPPLYSHLEIKAADEFYRVCRGNVDLANELIGLIDQITSGTLNLKENR